MPNLTLSELERPTPRISLSRAAQVTCHPDESDCNNKAGGDWGNPGGVQTQSARRRRQRHLTRQ